MSTYTKAQAKEADARLAERQSELYAAEDKLARAKSTIMVYAGARVVYTGRTATFYSFDGKTRAQVEDAIARIADHEIPAYDQDRADHAVTEYQRKMAVRDNANTLVELSHAEWRDNGRWSRFFLVHGGHIHSSTWCSSLRITTEISWLPELSGETEKEAVDAYGSTLCTKCFPSAPVEWTVGKVKTKAQLDKEVRSAERAAKQAEKDAKLVIDPDTGEALRDADGYALKTERAASNAILQAMFDLRLYGSDHPSAPSWTSYIDRAIPALAAKRAVSETDLRAEFDKKTAIKYRREMG